jgi:hypothetical protein
MVLLPLEVVPPLIPGAMVQPTGLTEQWVLDEKGERECDQASNHPRLDRQLSAVNRMIDMGAYKEMTYVWCLPRIIHFIVALGLAWPI